MAADTLRVAMLTQQRILGLLAMIKKDFLPFDFVVACFALGSELSFVLIVFLVTLVA